MTSRRTGEPPAAAPRPPPLTALGAPASPWRPTHRNTSSGGNGWTQTQTQRTTDTRTSHKGGRGPQTLTGPYPIAPRQRGPPHTGERMPRPEDHAISLNSPPRDAEVGGWASRDRRGPARADDGRRQPLGRKKAGNQDLESPYFPLPNQRSPRDPHACMPTAMSKGVTLRHSAGLAWRPRGRDPTPGDWNSRPSGRPASSNLSIRNYSWIRPK